MNLHTHSDQLRVKYHKELSFSGLRVYDAMRFGVLHLMKNQTLEEAIQLLIKHKAEAVLITDQRMTPIGVITKTELITAYYGELPLSLKVQDIMTTPVICCSADDKLDCALSLMQENRIHRLYVMDPVDHRAAGILSYPDIVGLLYRYCNVCENGLYNRFTDKEELIGRLMVKDVMKPYFKTMDQQVTLLNVIEELALSRMGAILLLKEEGQAAGVLSKTDIMLAYRRGLNNTTRACEVMSPGVYGCDENQPLEQAIREMIHNDLSRLFVYRDEPAFMTGMLSLADAARARSGSCQACSSSRIVPKEKSH